MERQFWVKFRRQEIGPFSSRQEALTAMREQIRTKELSVKYRDEILTGYGSGGAWADIQWTKVLND